MPSAHSAQCSSRQLNQRQWAKEDLIILNTPSLGPGTVLNEQQGKGFSTAYEITE